MKTTCGGADAFGLAAPEKSAALAVTLITSVGQPPSAWPRQKKARPWLLL